MRSEHKLFCVGLALFTFFWVCFLAAASGVDRSFNDCVAKAAKPELCRK